jgi:hypothetical protein
MHPDRRFKSIEEIKLRRAKGEDSQTGGNKKVVQRYDQYRLLKARN